MKNKIRLDVTYFIMLMLGSTCFGHHYAHHQELTTIALVTPLTVWFSSCCWMSVRTEGCYSLRSRELFLSLLLQSATSAPSGLCK